VRVLFGWLLLFGLVAAAAWATALWRVRARERSHALTVELAPDAPGSPARVLIGAPSGAEPLGGPQPPRSVPSRIFEDHAPIPERSTPPPAPKIFELEVRGGSTLSKICQDFYTQSDRPPLSEVVDKVAGWNELASPDDLRVGQTLQLPPLEQLFP